MSFTGNVKKWDGTLLPTPDTAGYPKVTVKTGTGAGEMVLTSGEVTVGTNNDKTGYTVSTVRASSMQRGSISIASNVGTGSAVISSVTTTRAFEGHTGSHSGGVAIVSSTSIQGHNFDTTLSQEVKFVVMELV